MPNNTPTYWSADGESLHTYARSIETLSGLWTPPPMRGEDIVIPYQPGQTYVQKVPDSRTLSLSMWVRGIAEGTAGSGSFAVTRQQFDENWNNLIRLLWQPDKQFNLTKRFYNAGVLRAATALAEFAGGMSPTMKGRSAAKTLVDLRLADPYFYDDVPQNFPLVNGDNIINVLGSAPTQNITLTINGSRTNAIVRRKLPTPDHQVEFHAALSSGQVVTIIPRNYTAMRSNGGPTFDASVDVRHSGASHWLQLKPGDNTITVSSSVGTGLISLSVKGAWI